MSDTVPLVAFAVFAIADWIAVARSDTQLEYLTKPAALAALLLYAAMGSEPSPWLIMALAFSLLGDVYLMLPVDLFAAGLGAFLLAHVAYIIDFDVPLASRLIWLIVALAISVPFALRIYRSVPLGSLRTAVAAYMFVLALMVGSALATGGSTAVVGALLFLISDTVLGWNRFVQPFPWARVVIIVTYHLGQLGLAHALRG